MELVEQASGTGQMLTSLDRSQPGGQKIDVAVALTEGLITGIAKGRTDYKLVGSYVRSSLTWAIITGTSPEAAKYQTVGDLRHAKVGVSRIGSGSHLMASVLALQQGWVTSEGRVEDREFVVNNDFQTLRDGVNQKPGHESGFFMWEWFTTKPFKDAGEVRYIGSLPTPWPSWTIAASTHTALDDMDRKDVLEEFLHELDETIRAFANEETRKDGSLEAHIEMVHHYKPEDIKAWASQVRWAGERTPDPEGVTPTDPQAQKTNAFTLSGGMIRNTLATLEKAGVVSSPAQPWDVTTFVDTDVARLV